MLIVFANKHNPSTWQSIMIEPLYYSKKTKLKIEIKTVKVEELNFILTILLPNKRMNCDLIQSSFNRFFKERVAVFKY